MKAFQYERPETVQAAATAGGQPGAKFIAGGTNLLDLMKLGVMQPDELPFSSGEFDSVLMDNVLEHIPQPERLLSEVHRVLRPDGRLLVGVPGARGWASDPDHKVFYDQDKLSACMAAAAFKTVENFYTPLWRSVWMDRHLRQYCLYGVFSRL